MKIVNIDTRAPEEFKKKDTKKRTDKLARELADLQHILYAEKKRSILIVFQGMDASGKDGTTRKVFRYCSPAGINAYPFKKPTEKEMGHDFLWRVHKLAPQKGMIQIFNRSHYEDVLIQRVHRWIDEDHVDHRFNAINAFERNLVLDNNTTIFKFYLHISQDRQKEKLQERIDNPRKQWKHNPNDWKEREKWDLYMEYYQDMIDRSEIPWYVVPADQRWYRDYFIAKTLLKEISKLNLKLPTFADNG